MKPPVITSEILSCGDSPDGRLAITLLTVEKSPAAARGGQPAPSNVPAPAGGQLVYTVSFQGKLLIEPSALRLDLQGQTRQLGQDVRIVSTTPSKVDETDRLVAGRASSVRNYRNALRIELEETGVPGRKLAMEVSAYNDAAAFR